MKKYLLGFVFVVVGGTFLPGAFVLADTSITNDITANTTWGTGGGTYIIENAISIDSGVTLTVDPGVVVKFRSIWTTLTVNGTLDAQGTASSSIYLTSIKDDTVGGDTNADGSATSPMAGDWRKIETSSGATTTFNYTKIFYGGYYDGYGVYNSGGTLDVINSTVASSTSYGLSHNAGITNIATSTFNGTGGYGVYGSGSGTISITNSNFYNNSASAGYFELSNTLTVSNSGNTASGTGERGFVVYSSGIGSNQTWQADTIPYIISAFTIPSGKTLTINPGAVVKFESIWSALTVDGVLSASGTSISPIVFTSIKDDTIGGDTNADGSATSPVAGDWRKIALGSGATSTISYANIRYGGYYDGYDVYNNGGTLTLQNSAVASSTSYGLYHGAGITNIATSTFSGTGGYGVYGSGSGSILLSGSTFYNNSGSAGYFELSNGLVVSNSGNTASGTGARGFVVYASSLGADQTWQADGVPYILSSLTIPSGKTLTINPNAMVKFESIWSALTVNGTLDAQGTVSSPIYMTSIKDDTIGGDTNADGSATTPTTGDWRKIAIGSGATTTLNYAKIFYGGYYDGYGVSNNGGVLDVSNSNIASSTSYGLYHGAGTTNIATSTFNGTGGYGFYGSGSGTLSISNSNFSNNSGSAGYFELSNGLVVSNSGNTASGTGVRGFVVYASSLGADQTWQADGVPYILSSLTIPSGKTLTINPNAVVKFESIWSALTVNGTLNASGYSLYPVYFTSLKDDTVGGDTNADGSATSPAAGDWRKIEIGSGATTTLGYANIRYGGYYDGYGIYNNGGALTISHSEIATSTSYGVYQVAGATTLTGSSDVHGQDYCVYASGGNLNVQAVDIHACTYGIYSSTDKTTIDVAKIHGTSYGFYVAGGTSNWINSSEIYNNSVGILVNSGSANIGSNSIHDNSSYGAYNSTGSDIHAEYNYWGASDGPSGEGTGSGDPITVRVLWDPYLEEAHYLSIGSAGLPLNSVDAFEDIDWNWSTSSPITSTGTLSAWYSSLDTWNSLGEVTISTTTWPSVQDLTVSSTTRSDASWGGQWYSVPSPDTLELNSYWLEQFNDNQRKHIILHELGHALGLGHSYENESGNIMYYALDTSTPTTTLGTQDISDYNYCWADIIPNCKNPQ